MIVNGKTEKGNKLNKRTRAGEERNERKSARAQLQLPSTRTFYLRHLIFQSIKFPGFARPRPCKRQPRGRRFSTWRGDSERKRYQVSLLTFLSLSLHHAMLRDCVSLRINTVTARCHPHLRYVAIFYT